MPPRKSIEDIGEVECTAKNIPITKLYDNVILKKRELEKEGYTCYWFFVDVGSGRQLFLGDTDLFVDGTKSKMGKSKVRVATIYKELSKDQDPLHLSLYHHPRKGAAYIYGGTKINEDKAQYMEALKTIKQFSKLTGIELKVSCF